jgi:hypothetical protein
MTIEIRGAVVATAARAAAVLVSVVAAVSSGAVIAVQPQLIWLASERIWAASIMWMAKQKNCSTEGRSSHSCDNARNKLIGKNASYLSDKRVLVHVNFSN